MGDNVVISHVLHRFCLTSRLRMRAHEYFLTGSPHLPCREELQAAMGPAPAAAGGGGGGGGRGGGIVLPPPVRGQPGVGRGAGEGWVLHQLLT
jgi:hypothetical protein